MSETRPNIAEILSKTAARAAARGAREVVADATARAHGWLRSDGALQMMVRASGGHPPRRDLRFRVATAADATRYARDIGTDSATTFRRRLGPTTHCCLVLDDDAVVHASWVTTNRAWTGEIKAFLTPPPGDAYIYESFTRADQRGRGIYPFALAWICHELGGRGIARAWIAVEVGNEPSTRAIAKAGFEHAFVIPFRRRWGRVVIAPPTGPLAEAADAFISGRK